MMILRFLMPNVLHFLFSKGFKASCTRFTLALSMYLYFLSRQLKEFVQQTTSPLVKGAVLE
ncbi:hypothetical protein BYT27DRAFT_7192397 [Phlegmacium glaucopus]|nr:hypothetical protein BYT27DRAFT_7192397 [Phlegmacium glaucopus]